jgi:hypothetical protein
MCVCLPSDIDGEITTDGAWSRSQWVGSTKENTSSLDSITTLEDDGGDWARIHVLDETGKEWLVRKIGICIDYLLESVCRGRRG